ncbi:S8 family serine peptidase [Frankia sp. Cr2]|uniref:S8 family serine peptidase n=1 Tax=Frankia sp. Cr2 TaxID=3073932 RepID=UPI002AD2B07B|nr:S8 family serine peptidase [Frankia sp. Cr2]
MVFPAEFDSNSPVPDLVLGYVSVRSQGGVSVTEATDFTSAEPFYAASGDWERARSDVEAAGLIVTAESRLGFSVAGPPAAYEELTSGEIVTREVLQRLAIGRTAYVTQLDIVGTDQPRSFAVGRAGSDAIEAIVLERPRIHHNLFPSPIPPSIAKFHLTLPDDVAVLLGCVAAHRAGHVGSDVTVAMVDTGQYSHPYFLVHNYRVERPVAVVPGTSPSKDPVGHGTGESANIFAVAPGATLRPYRVTNKAGQLVGAITGFLRAKAGHPQIITNSWGGDLDYPTQDPLPPYYRAWVAEIRDAIETGIVVVFSAGNGQFSVEPQVPGVISAGGVYATAGVDLVASDYASGYASPFFPGIDVPTVSGLVGTIPRAQYLLLPIPPGCGIDVDESKPFVHPTFPDSPDGTTADDGWALFSGTSAAAPQLAGAVAVLLGALPALTTAQITEALKASAVDVTAGHNHPRYNVAAGPGPDLATGAGLVNVSAALDYAQATFS